MNSTTALPMLSIIIPSRGRRDSLIRLLNSLSRQAYPADRVEVIVALDGDLDRSANAVRAIPQPWPLQVVVLKGAGRSRHQGNGAAITRNKGAAYAVGDLLVFLDDDVIPVENTLLLEHADAHGHGVAAVIGPCPPRLHEVTGMWAQQVRNWWVEQSSHIVSTSRLTFTDVLTGNLSMPRDLFSDLGGFSAMPRREDWELGYRLEKLGVRIRAAPGAAVQHDADLSLQSALDDRWREGAGDVALARLHPEILARLPLASLEWLAPRSQRVAELAISRAQIVTALVSLTRYPLAVLDRSGARREFHAVLRRAQFMAYWGGVGSAVGGLVSWRKLRDACHPVERSAPAVDLYDGAGLPELEGAAEVEVRYRGMELGRAPIIWGGLPFNHRQFTETLVKRYGHLAYGRCGSI